MELNTLLAELDSRQALIVHFSHLSNMRAGGVFPADLQAAIANRACWALSCCVIWPGHAMDLPGDIGLVFRPTATDQVLSVANTDSGSSQLACGEELSGGLELTPETLAATFSVAPGDYNEWRVRGAEVSGVFVASGNGVRAKKLQRLTGHGAGDFEDIWPAAFSLAEVKTAFPGLDLITMTHGGPKVLG